MRVPRALAAALLVGASAPALALGGLDATTGAFSWRRPLVVPAGASAPDDLVALAGPVTVEGMAGGDVVSVGGDVVVRGSVRGDVLSVFGDVRVEGPGAEVGGDALALFGTASASGGGRIAGAAKGLWSPPRSGGLLAWAFSPPLLVLRLVKVTFLVLAALVAALAAPDLVARAAAEMRRHPVPLAGIGLLATMSLGLTAVLFVALVVVVVGVPLLLLLALVAMTLAAAANAACFHAVGEQVLERLFARRSAGRAKVLAGALVFAVLAFIPVLGEVAWLAAFLCGTGAVLAARARPRAAVPVA